MKIEPFSLPDQLTLGCATASAQIEGGDKNHSWYAWSIIEGHIKDESTTLRACRHWDKTSRDLLLMKSLGISEYRFSIEWSRIEPRKGVFDPDALRHYRDEIEQMRELGIRPLVTLHHFSNPLWFEEMGAFLCDNAPEIFLRYATFVVSSLQDLVDEYVTINEPNVYAVNGYVFGMWPPGRRKVSEYFHAISNLAASHILTYQMIHDRYSDRAVRVGFANHLRIFTGKGIYPANHLAAKVMEYCFQDIVTDVMAFGRRLPPLPRNKAIRRGRYFDFIGINYYSRSAISRFADGVLPGRPTNDLGWEIYPEGLGILLRRQYKRYRAPVYITENGTCDAKDHFRPLFICDHLKQIAESNVPVEKYYHWTLTDNFEWAEGESAPFGLFAYDFDKDEVSERKSARLYRDIITNHGLTEDMIDRYLTNSSSP